MFIVTFQNFKVTNFAHGAFLVAARPGGRSGKVKFPLDLRSKVTWIQFVSSYPQYRLTL